MTDTIHIYVNRKVLIWARESCGHELTTQEYQCLRAKVDFQNSAYEA